MTPPNNDGAEAFGRFVGNVVPLALMSFAAAQVDGTLRVLLILWVAFIVLMQIGSASARK